LPPYIQLSSTLVIVP